MRIPRRIPPAGRARVWLPALLLAAGAAAGQPGRQAQDDVSSALQTRRQTQGEEDAWAADKLDLEQQYRLLQAQVKWLQDRQEDQRQRRQAQQERLHEMRRRLEEADRLEASLQDTLQSIYGRLQETVAAGLPFLPQERRFRLDTLKEELGRSDVPAAEKLRRLLEALQVEAAYGSTIEVYGDTIGVQGQELHADLLRLGRVALLWMTPDRKRAGVYDQGEARWLEVTGSQRRRIGLAMDMADRLRPIELIALPLGRISPTPEATP